MQMHRPCSLLSAIASAPEQHRTSMPRFTPSESTLLVSDAADKVIAASSGSIAQTLFPSVESRPCVPVPPPKVSVVVLNWNGKEDTLQCLASLRQLTYPNYRVCVVDNGSSDDSVNAIATRFPEVGLIPVGRNLGYAGGNNVGIRAAIDDHGAAYVLLLNNDTVVAPDLLEWMVGAATATPNVGAVGAKTYFLDRPDVIWASDIRWQQDIRRIAILDLGATDQDPNATASVATDFVCGCALLAPTSALERVGLLEEAFFLNYEDSDWCARARELNFGMVLSLGAKVWHRGSASFGGGESPMHAYFMTRNRLLWIERHIGLGTALVELAGEIRSLVGALWLEMRWVEVGQRTTMRGVIWRLLSLPRRLSKRCANPYFRVKALATRDYVTRRFGDCPPAVRLLRRHGGVA